MLTNLLNKLQPKIELVGLDIGTASVKLVQLVKDKDGYTASAAVKEEIETVSEDIHDNTASVAEAVKKCLKKANVNTQNVACGISGPEVMVRGFKFPPLPDHAIEQAVRFEVQQVCPLENKDLVLDYQLIDDLTVTDEQKASKVYPRQGLVVACNEKVVKEKTTLLTEAGAKPMLVDSDALAVLNCLNELQILDSSDTVAVIDVGWELTNVIIYGHDGLPFVRDLNNAGRHIIRNISTQLELSEEDIMKTLTDTETVPEIRSKVLLALNDAIRPLAMAVNETLRYYSFQEKTSGAKKIFLCGGFPLIDAFTDFFSDALPVEVQLLDPFRKIKCQADEQGNELLNTYGPGLVVAAGLAMRTI